MSYDYYRSRYPGWGTSDFRLGTPPPPPVWPQPAWRGWDYYQAYGISPDHGLFSSILKGLRRSPRDDAFSSGDVRSLHRRVYGGMINLAMILPNDLGSAAAYEAYRSWKTHSMFSQPLGGDPHREREGLVGLAVAEASRLWNYSGRPMDTFALRAALESAANTASMLYYRKLGREVGVPPPPRTDIYERDYAYGSVGGMTPPGTVRTAPVPIPRARTSSFGGGLPGTIGSSPSMYNGGAGGSPYAAGAGLPYAGSGSPYAGGGSPYVGNGSPYQGRGSPYRAGGSPYLGGSAIGGGVVPPYAGSAGIPGAGPPYPGGSQMMAGQPGGVYPGPLPPGQYGYTTQAGVVPGQVTFPPQGSMLMQGGNGVPYPTQGSMYAGSVGGGVIPGQVGSAYSTSGIIPGTTAYAGGTLPGYSGSVGSVEGYPPGTIIIKPGRSRRSSSSGRHRHRHHSSSRHRHSSRSRSMEPPLVVQSVPVGGGYDTGGSWYR